MSCNLLNHNFTLFNNCCPTRYPKKSVKLTGCPLTDLEIIFFKYFDDHGGDKCFCQYFSTAVFNSGIILCAICLSSGKLGWLYKVERYLKIMSQKWSVCSKKSKDNEMPLQLIVKIIITMTIRREQIYTLQCPWFQHHALPYKHHSKQSLLEIRHPKSSNKF